MKALWRGCAAPCLSFIRKPPFQGPLLASPRSLDQAWMRQIPTAPGLSGFALPWEDHPHPWSRPPEPLGAPLPGCLALQGQLTHGFGSPNLNPPSSWEPRGTNTFPGALPTPASGQFWAFAEGLWLSGPVPGAISALSHSWCSQMHLLSRYGCPT